MKKLISILLVLCFIISAAQTVATTVVTAATVGSYKKITINLPTLYVGGKVDYNDISGEAVYIASATEDKTVSFDADSNSGVKIKEYYWCDHNDDKIQSGTAYEKRKTYYVYITLSLDRAFSADENNTFLVHGSRYAYINEITQKTVNGERLLAIKAELTMSSIWISFDEYNLCHAYMNGNEVSRVYPGETFTIKADLIKPEDGWYFDHWEQESGSDLQIKDVNSATTTVYVPKDADTTSDGNVLLQCIRRSSVQFASCTPSAPHLGDFYIGTPEANITISFTPKELPQAMKDAGYTIKSYISVSRNYSEIDLVDGTTYTLNQTKIYDTEKGFDRYILRLQIVLIDSKGESVYAVPRIIRLNLISKPSPINGSIYYTSGVCINTPVTVSLSEQLAATPNLKYQWECFPTTAGSWKKIKNATSISYTPTRDMLGTAIRLRISSDNLTGDVVSQGKIVQKQANGNMPAKPVLSVSGQTIKIENYSEDQEYMIYGSGYKLTEWNEATEFEGNTVDAGAYASFYIYTRYKETATTQAGYHIASQWITVKDPSIVETYARGYSYPDGNKLYIAVGESAEINYALTPTNANTAIPDLKPTDSSILAISQQKSVNKLLVRGLKAGTVVINPYNAGTTTRWETSYNTASYITVVVYDPNDMQYAHFTADAPYGDIALEVGDTYTPESTDEVDVVFTPESAKDVFTNYRWYVINKSNMFGAPTMGTTSEDGSVTVDPATGKLTALKAGKATLYLYALKAGDYTATAPTSNATPYYIKQVTVTVTDPSLPPFEGVSISQTEADVMLGNKLYLEACPAPINSAENYTVIWGTSNNLIATVEDGVVTTKGYGAVIITAKITVNGVTKSASCVVNVVEVTELGDVNGDGYVDNLDAAMILKYDAGIIDLDPTELAAADVNSDGYADNLDAATILKYDVGLINGF